MNCVGKGPDFTGPRALQTLLVTSPVALLTCPAETTYGGQKTLAHSFRGFSHSQLERQSRAPSHGSGVGEGVIRVAWCRRKHHRLEPEVATEDSTVSWGPSFQKQYPIVDIFSI